MARGKAASAELWDRELEELPPPARWREWMARVEAVVFASPVPVGRDVLLKVVGSGCNLDLLIDDIQAELRDRPYELVAVAGGWQHRTRPRMAGAIRAAGMTSLAAELSQHESLVLMAIAYFQPVTRGELGRIFAKEVSRDTIAAVHREGLIEAGPRSPQPGAPYTYVTTPAFLSRYGFETLRDLPEIERLEDAGLLSKAALLEPDILESLYAAEDGEELGAVSAQQSRRVQGNMPNGPDQDV